jgi:hypothetical protein
LSDLQTFADQLHAQIAKGTDCIWHGSYG